MTRPLCVAATLAFLTAAASAQAPKLPAAEKPIQLAPGVWFLQTNDIGLMGSNKGWVIFDDFVLVIDTGFPKGAEECLAAIRQTTDRPIRYAIDTHYHADHSFGNGAFTQAGAQIVAHENARLDYLRRNLDNYKKSANKEPLYAKYPAVVPQLTFSDKMIFDDGNRRVEVHYLGHAHTSGCVWTWLPKEKILFTGDACVNGPFNYMGDCDLKSWLNCLDKAGRLGAEIIGPGHGASGKATTILANQKRYFTELRDQVTALVMAGKNMEEVEKAVDIPFWKQWTGEKEYHAMFKEGVRVAYRQISGKEK
jgi:glyoxylase-like metal-dependent hydrolase (beta-lactamase superfamily II)